MDAMERLASVMR
jgi:hypothetical protein